ncbi:hypothetical protein PTTG_10941, partial [Puccinia triticina 1-1 BBBD Race 1]
PLPIELALYILLKLAQHNDPRHLLSARAVSKSWQRLAEDSLIWKQSFLSQPTYHQPPDPPQTQPAHRTRPAHPALDPNQRSGAPAQLAQALPRPVHHRPPLEARQPALEENQRTQGPGLLSADARPVNHHRISHPHLRRPSPRACLPQTSRASPPNHHRIQRQDHQDL